MLIENILNHKNKVGLKQETNTYNEPDDPYIAVLKKIMIFYKYN